MPGRYSRQIPNSALYLHGVHQALGYLYIIIVSPAQLLPDSLGRGDNDGMICSVPRPRPISTLSLTLMLIRGSIGYDDRYLIQIDISKSS